MRVCDDSSNKTYALRRLANKHQREEEFLAPGHVWLGIYLMEICRGLIEQPSIVAVAKNNYKAFIN